MRWHKAPQDAALWAVRSLVVPLVGDGARLLEPPRVRSSERIVTGIGAAITTGVTAVVGYVPVVDRIRSLPGTADNLFPLNISHAARWPVR
jgi:hypothetical protein